MTDLGHWEGLLTEEILPYGFVYKITNLTNNRKYIGKKQCLTLKKRPPLKGKKNRRISEIETDWKSYTSSSKELNKDIEKFGKKNFKFEILFWCQSKSELAYLETLLQFKEEVLLRDDYYNGIINIRLGKIKLSQPLPNLKGTQI